MRLLQTVQLLGKPEYQLFFDHWQYSFENVGLQNKSGYYLIAVTRCVHKVLDSDWLRVGFDP